jgi:primosomal protein N'
MHPFRRRIHTLEAVMLQAKCHTCGQALRCPQCEGSSSPIVVEGIRERLQRRLEEIARRQQAASKDDKAYGL